MRNGGTAGSRLWPVRGETGSSVSSYHYFVIPGKSAADGSTDALGAAKIPFVLALEPARHLGAPSTPAATGSRTSAAASGTPWRAGAALLLPGHEQILLKLARVAEVGLCDLLEDVAKYDPNI
jgi:hypothetical protein